jgi:hypothetical protein
LREDHAAKVRDEHTRAEHLRFCERIKKDIEKTFSLDRSTTINEVFWSILPPGEWTVDSVLSHYAELHRQNPQIHFDLERLERMFSLGPSSLYVGMTSSTGTSFSSSQKQKRLSWNAHCTVTLFISLEKTGRAFLHFPKSNYWKDFPVKRHELFTLATGIRECERSYSHEPDDFWSGFQTFKPPNIGWENVLTNPMPLRYISHF